MWGKEPLDSNPDGFFGHAVIDAMKRGGQAHRHRPAHHLAGSRADILNCSCAPAPTRRWPWLCSTSSSTRTSTTRTSWIAGASGSTSWPNAWPRCRPRRQLRSAACRPSRSTARPGSTPTPSRPPSPGALHRPEPQRSPGGPGHPCAHVHHRQHGRAGRPGARRHDRRRRRACRRTSTRSAGPR